MDDRPAPGRRRDEVLHGAPGPGARGPDKGQFSSDKRPRMLNLKFEKSVTALHEVTLIEAFPQVLRLLRLLWKRVPVRTLFMLGGNFTKSLIPAYDLSVRARLIELINTTIKDKAKLRGKEIGRLLVLQLVSLIARQGLEVALDNNQLAINADLSRTLKRQLLDIHLRLDSAALATPTTQALLDEAVAMAKPSYLDRLVDVVFGLTNAVTDLSARVVATSRTINYDALPYFMAYSFLPLMGIINDRMRERTWHWPDNAKDRLRKADLASIAFSYKARREVSLLNLQEYIANEYSAVENRIENVETRQTGDSQYSSRILDIAQSISNSAIYAFLAWRSEKSTISIADLHLIENTTTNLITTGDRAIHDQQNSSTVLQSLISFYKALDLKPALPVPDRPQAYHATGAGMAIEFIKVCFRYSPDGPLVLNNVSFKVEPGQIVALVGFNGAGKSSIINLLGRVSDPTSGKILINGVDLAQYDPKDLYEHMSFTHQDFAKWPLTGYENVAVGRIDLRHDRMRVEMAALATGAYEVLDAKHEGKDPKMKTPSITGQGVTDTRLWDRRLSQMTSEMQEAQTDARNSSMRGPRNRKNASSGIELSGGQWQKVALARSFLRNGELLVLDEPSANLDPQAEFDLFSQLLKSRISRTTLFITHRLGVVKSSDLIIFLDKGMVTEQGSHEELMSIEQGQYKHLVEIQTEGFKR